MKSYYEVEKRLILRLRLLVLATLAAIVWLTAVLFRMQVRRSDYYEVSLSRQSMRRVRLPALRGIILDRSGNILAHNRPSYELVLYIEEFRRPGGWDNTVRAVMDTLAELGVLMESPPLIDEAGLRAHIRRRLPMPLTAWRDLDETRMARFAERRREFAGVDIQPAPLRTYPQGAYACHLIGYVGRATPGGADFSFYLPEVEGKNGIEARFDAELRGEAGGMLIRVDAAGYRWEEIPERAAVAGADLQLTIDLSVQRWAESELDGMAGAVVVMDPRNGDVLALASAPRYDLNLFVPVIGTEAWGRLRSDRRAPLLNRAVAGRYPPGSIFKPVTAIAALVNDVIGVETIYECAGEYPIGGISIRCWQRRGHGGLKLRRALEQSCNPFFIDLAIRGGYEAVYRQAAALGLGTRSGIDLPFESPGLLPDDFWKRRARGDAWRPGDTANVAIGQGDLLVTPIQMAVLASALANGGDVWTPRLAMGVRPPGSLSMRPLPPLPAASTGWPAEIVRAVRAGMIDVVQASSGTGRRARVEGVTVAGKTGTAEVGPKDLGRRHAWMIAYAPAERPRYTVAMVIEDAESGGTTVAPRVGRLLQRLLGGGGT